MKTFLTLRTLSLVSVLLISFNIFSQVDSDGTYQTATGISINSVVTGSVGYKINDQTTDYEDWYKFTIPSDGKIEIVEIPSTDLYSGIAVYDLGGTHEFRSKSARKASADTLIYENLAAGEYYVKIFNWSYSFGSYTFSVNFTSALYSNDPEPNNSKDFAKTIPINSEITGHVGFYRNDSIDYDDWYKFTIPSDGKIEIVENTSSNLYSGMAVYDLGGTHEFWSRSARKASSDTLIYKNLAAGVYYLKIYNWSYSFGSYKVRVNFYPTDYANDSEPNNSKDFAKTIPINSEITGHVGFYRNDSVDYDDWFRFTIPSDGKIEIVESTSSDLYSGMAVYDTGGTHEFWSKSARKASSDTLIYKNLAAGEYYLKIYNWSYCFGSYKLKVNFYPTEYANDIEPNNTYSNSKQLIFNVVTTGHVGFYSNDQVDYDDWYWFTLPSSGKIKIVETVSKDLCSGISLFNTNGTQELYSKVGRKATADTLIYNEVLPGGNYYIRINNWSYTFGSYSLIVSNYNPSSLSDITDKKLSICIIPGSHHLLIKGPDIQNVQIFDLFGKVINIISPVSIRETCEVDVSNCKTGIYVIKIMQADKIYTDKISIR